jgi:hypothetical protein
MRNVNRAKLSTIDIVSRSTLVILFLTGLNAWATSPDKAGEYGALRAAAVVHVATREELMESGDYKALLASGVDEASIVDGSLIIVRLLCCRDNVKYSAPAILYNPKGLTTVPDDIVEFRVGGVNKQNSKAEFNILTRVIQQTAKNDGACWWDPKNDHLWMRFVYCDWMPKEGWIKQESKMNPAWYKPFVGTDIK